MAHYKGAGIVFLRKELERAGADKTKLLLQRLSPETQDVFLHCLSGGWIPLEQARTIIEKAAAVLYPDGRIGYEELGVKRAHYYLTGIYKALLSVSTVAFAMSQSAKFWSVSYDQGRAYSEKEPDRKQGRFCVEMFPELPECFRRMSTGFVKQTLSMTTAKNVSVRHDDSNPLLWRWEAQWD